MGRNYGNELILAAGTGRIGITLIIDASNITVEPTKSTWMPTAVGARSLRCRAITAADTDSDIRANPDQRRSRPDTQRMILESFGELEDKRPGPRRSCRRRSYAACFVQLDGVFDSCGDHL